MNELGKDVDARGGSTDNEVLCIGLQGAPGIRMCWSQGPWFVRKRRPDLARHGVMHDEVTETIIVP